MALEHGGNVNAAATRFGIPSEQWTDLSTGISPWSWPVPELPQAVWQTLPYPDDKLERVAAEYYGCDRDAILAVPGSQYALQLLPTLMRKGRVAMPLRGYAEHRVAWMNAGHDIVDYVDGGALRALLAAEAVDHVLVINPNNPTGEMLPQSQLQEIHLRLRNKGGWLVVDEAFADTYAEFSLASHCPLPGLVVYRSVGKFFGLAGARLGFMLAPASLCAELQSVMPPWLLSHPARWIGAAALSDKSWQCEQRQRLEQFGGQWRRALQDAIPDLHFVGTTLFASGVGASDYCHRLYEALGRRALLVRLFEGIDGHGIVRFGLPLPDVRDRVMQLIQDSLEECECGTE